MHMPDYLFTCYRQLTVRRKSCAIYTYCQLPVDQAKRYRAKMLPIYGYGVNVNKFCH